MFSRDLLFELLERLPWGVRVVDRELSPVVTNHPQQPGGPCWRTRHGLDTPCSEQGRDCPIKAAFETGKNQSAFHVHEDDRGTVHIQQILAIPLFGSSDQPQWVAEVTVDVTADRWAQARLERLDALLGVFLLLEGLEPRHEVEFALGALPRLAEALGADSFALFLVRRGNTWELAWQQAVLGVSSPPVFAQTVEVEEALAEVVARGCPAFLDPEKQSHWVEAFTNEKVTLVLVPLVGDRGATKLAAFAVRPWRAAFPPELQAALRGFVSAHRATLQAAVRAQEQEEKRSNEALRAFAAGIAHDLANTLGVILLALQGNSNLGNPALHSQLLAAAQQAAELVANLRTFAQAGTLPREEVELGAFLAELTPVLEGLLPGRVRFVYDGSKPFRVWANKGQLKQVLCNLVVNAGEAMGPEGVVTITLKEQVPASQDLLRFPRALPGRYAGFEVSDTGHGIAPEDLPRIFEPHFSKHKTRKSGLGLAVVKTIVEEHAGFVRVESTLGQGTRFGVFLPSLDHAATAPPSPPSPGCRKAVLLLEDDQALASMARALLEKNQYSVTVVSNFAQLTDTLAREGACYQVLVADRKIEGVDALELLADVAKRYNLRVVLWSGDVEGIPPCFRGAVVPKPGSAEALVHAIEQAAGSHD